MSSNLRPSGQSKGTKYYWKVVAKDGKTEVSSPVRSYTTLAPANNTPTAPTLTSPANAATGIALNTKLVWQTSTDADGDPITYDVYLGKTNPPITKVVDSKNVLEFTPTGQTNATTYYWKVVAKDGKTETSSDLRSYTTIAARPTITSVSPLTVQANSTTTFTVIGTGLKSSFAVHIDDVEISEISASSDGTKLTFKGVANKFHGDNKNGVIKLYSADVNCADDTDHPACPVNATFHVTITEAPASGQTGTVTIQGQTYKTVTIGNQTWLAENLNAYIDGSVCYDNNSSNCAKYGRLYTWEQAKRIADQIPGWHLPTDAEWTTLTNHLGSSAGTKLKKDGDSGFEALLAGSRTSGDYFYNLGYSGYFWSSSPDGSSYAWSRFVSASSSNVYRYDTNRTDLFSIRLVKDE